MKLISISRTLMVVSLVFIIGCLANHNWASTVAWIGVFTYA